jgi:hypothetical protein
MFFFFFFAFFATIVLGLVSGFGIGVAGIIASRMTLLSIAPYRKRKKLLLKWLGFWHELEKRKAIRAFTKRTQAMLDIIPNKYLPNDDVKRACEKIADKLVPEFAELFDDLWEAQTTKLGLPKEEEDTKRPADDATAEKEINEMIFRQSTERQLLADDVRLLTLAIASALNRMDAERRNKARNALDRELSETLDLIASLAPTSLPDNVAQLPDQASDKKQLSTKKERRPPAGGKLG